jgi:phosphoribosyl 1,2-cyclic phosphodiesterase
MAWRAATSDNSLQVRFWGVRGSMCASGPEFVEFGGHTPCVEVRCGERLFILDAGSGLSALGHFLGKTIPAEVDLLLSHVHLDHVMGLPFFKPAALDAERMIHTHCGHLDGDSAAEALERLYAPPLFPIGLAQLPARFAHHGFRAGDTLTFADGARVETHPLNHPGGSTGYRFRHGGRSICYISDLEHTDPWPDPSLVSFVRAADLVIYDGMFAETDYKWCKGWGHSTWQKGVELCRAADVHGLAIFHICPSHTDAALRRMEAEMQAVMPTAFIARERQALAFENVEPEHAVAVPADSAKVPAE